MLKKRFRSGRIMTHEKIGNKHLIFECYYKAHGQLAIAIHQYLISRGVQCFTLINSYSRNFFGEMLDNLPKNHKDVVFCDLVVEKNRSGDRFRLLASWLLLIALVVWKRPRVVILPTADRYLKLVGVMNNHKWLFGVYQWKLLLHWVGHNFENVNDKNRILRLEQLVQSGRIEITVYDDFAYSFLRERWQKFGEDKLRFVLSPTSISTQSSSEAKDHLAISTDLLWVGMTGSIQRRKRFEVVLDGCLGFEVPGVAFFLIGPFEPGYEIEIREKYGTFIDSKKLYVKNTWLSVKYQNTVINAADILIPNADFSKDNSSDIFIKGLILHKTILVVDNGYFRRFSQISGSSCFAVSENDSKSWEATLRNVILNQASREPHAQTRQWLREFCAPENFAKIVVGDGISSIECDRWRDRILTLKNI